jgi:hypothetical protein
MPGHPAITWRLAETHRSQLLSEARSRRLAVTSLSAAVDRTDVPTRFGWIRSEPASPAGAATRLRPHDAPR